MSSQPAVIGTISDAGVIDDLADIWFDLRVDRPTAQERAGQRVAQATSRGDSLAADRSLALSAYRLGLWEAGDPSARARLQDILEHLWQCGDPAAIQLGECGWAMLTASDAADRERGFALLERHAALLEPETDELVRICQALTRSALHAYAGECEAAIAYGLQVARRLGSKRLSLLRVCCTLCLSGCCLTVGDVQTAREELQATLRDLGALGPTGCASGHYNLLMALVLEGRLDEAAELLRAQPWLTHEDELLQSGMTPELIAVIRLHEGRTEAADALLGRAVSDRLQRLSTIMGERVWMEAMVHLGCDRHEAARDCIEGHLQRAGHAGQPENPLNATQLYRLLADAREALGDTEGALEALRLGQGQCAGWVNGSVRARLVALQDIPARPGSHRDPLRQRSRQLEGIDRATQATTAGQLQPAVGDGTRSPFMAQVVHEIRNPLMGVIGLTSMLTLSELNASEQRLASLANSQAQLLLSLCNDLLDLARYEAGRFELFPRPTDVGALVQMVAETVRPRARLKGLELLVWIDPALPTSLMADGIRLQQIVLNLLVNAVKFTLQGRIELQARWSPASPAIEPDAPTRTSGALSIRVRDTGIGIPPARIPSLFTESGTASSEASAQGHGAGLGLAISHGIVQSMGGCMKVRSAPGEGACFTVELPMAPAGTGHWRVDS